MKRLTYRQMQSLLMGISELHASHEPESLPDRIFAATKQIISADCVNFTVWDRDRIKLDNPAEFPIKAMHTQPHISVSPAMIETYNHFFHEEPFKKPFYRNGLTYPTRISDIMPDTRYYRLGIYNEHFRKIGVDRSMAVALASADASVMVSLALNRNKREFTDAEAAAFAALRPHVIAANLSAEALADLRREQALHRRALEESERGLVLLDARRQQRVRSMTRRAHELLKKYFAEPTNNNAGGGGHKLPDVVARWLAHRERCGMGEDAATVVPDLEVRRGAATLRMRAIGEDEAGRMILLLDEIVLKSSMTAVASLGLTKRESEILSWVARGKTNAEVAVLCGISARTVQKHLEHIIQKLGVESRMAAAARLGMSKH